MPAAADSPLSERDPILPATWRGTEGFFRAAQDRTGRWSLFDPDGRDFFCRAVNAVRPTGSNHDAAPPADAASQLRRWGFNALGPGADESLRADGLPFIGTVDFISTAPALVAPGLRLPDVFSPDWRHSAVLRALAACRSLTSSRQLIGWAADDQAEWAQPAGIRAPTLLQYCLSLEPRFAAYHAAWEFVLAPHGGRLEALAQAWGVALRNREVVREMTRAELGLGTPGYWRDQARWTREFARRYFTITAAAIREADPNHLTLGCHSPTPPGAHVLAESVYPAVDVALRHWRNLPESTAAPVLAASVTWAAPEFTQAATARERALTSVERMLRRGRAALNRVARHPATVGYLWAQWQDDPGEQPPFARGLVHVGGTEALEHTEALTRFNAHAESLRRIATNVAPFK